MGKVGEVGEVGKVGKVGEECENGPPRRAARSVGFSGEASVSRWTA